MRGSLYIATVGWLMIHTLLAIAALHWLVLVTPGPNVLVVATLAAAGQRRAALFAAAGVTLVAGTWALLAIAGLHAVFAAHPSVRGAVQAAGAAYLIHVAVRLWRTRAPAAAAAAAQSSGLSAFRLGALTNIANPKAALFFGSVFTTAMPAEPSGLLNCLAVVTILVNAMAWHAALAVALSNSHVSTAYAARAPFLGRAAAVGLAAFGGRLLLESWRSLRAI